MSLFYCGTCEGYRATRTDKEESVCRACGGTMIRVEPGRMG